MALTGASSAHSETPLELTKLPIVHCSANGVNKKSASCIRQKTGSLRVLRKNTIMHRDASRNSSGMSVENRCPKLQ